MLRRGKCQTDVGRENFANVAPGRNRLNTLFYQCVRTRSNSCDGVSPPSITRTPIDIPLMIRFRIRRFCGAGKVPPHPRGTRFPEPYR